MAKQKEKPPQRDALDTLAAGDLKMVIALLLWKERYRNPDMAVQITAQDLKGFEDCCNYLEVRPDVMILRPQGRPAQAAIAAVGNRRAVMARAAEPPRPWVVVGVVQRGTMDGIKPIENDEEGARKRDDADAQRRAKDRAVGLAAALLSDLAQNQFSVETVREAAASLTRLARA